jgi:folate-binding protein YgfZ
MSLDPLPTPAALGSLEGALRLDDWGVIRAQGPDAATFLQGQLTNDVVGLGAGRARLAGYCSAKGRLLATFVVWRDAQGDLLLACSADLLAPTLKRLSMFVLRAKCKLSDATAAVPLWGVAGAAAQHVMNQAEGALAQPWHCATLSGPAAQPQAIRLADAVLPDGAAPLSMPRVLLAGATEAPAAAALGSQTWRWLEVQSGTARISAATVEQFVPQMVNLEVVGGVNFQKGCYPGQEVVARSQYRGTLKRRAYVVQGAAAMRPGQEVFEEADPTQPAGMVVLAGEHAGSFAALVELKIAAAEQGALHLERADGPRLQVGALPYALPGLAA